MTEHAFSLKIDVLFPPPQEAFPATSIDCSDKHHAYAVIALRGGGSSPLLAGPAAPRGVGSPGFVFFFCSLAGEGAAEKSSCTSERSARKKQQKKAKNKIKKKKKFVCPGSRVVSPDGHVQRCSCAALDLRCPLGAPCSSWGVGMGLQARGACPAVMPRGIRGVLCAHGGTV